MPDVEPGSIVNWNGPRSMEAAVAAPAPTQSKVVVDVAEVDAAGPEIEQGLAFSVVDQDGNERLICRIATLRPPDDPLGELTADYVQRLTVTGHI